MPSHLKQTNLPNYLKVQLGMAKAPETDGETETRTGWVGFGVGLAGLNAGLGIDIIF